jgi:hypothetical protein
LRYAILTSNSNCKLTPQILQQDTDAFNGLGSIPSYTTNRRQATAEALQMAYQTMQVRRQTEKERQAFYQDSVDATREAEWEFHNAVLAMKEVVRGQFGSDSNEARAVGLKKKSERKRPVRTKPATVKATATVG